MMNATEITVKKLIVATGLFLASVSSANAVQCIVEGYYRADGTYVKSYAREQTNCVTTKAANPNIGRGLAVLAVLFVLNEIMSPNSMKFSVRHGFEEDLEKVEIEEGMFECAFDKKPVQVWTRQRGTFTECQ